MPINFFQPALKIVRVDADLDANKAKVVGQHEGLMATILRIFGIEDKNSLTFEPTGVWHQTSSFTGETKVYCPVSHISSSVYVMNKPVELLVAGLALLPLFGVGLIFLIVYLFAKKRVTIGIITDGNTAESLRLKAKGDQLENLLDVVEVMQNLIAGSPSSAPPEKPRKPEKKSSVHEAPTPPPSSSGPRVIGCPHCGTKIQVTAAHVGRNVLCPSCRGQFVVE